MGAIIYRFNLNISPKMSYGIMTLWYYVIVWYYVTELHAYDFVTKNFAIKKGYYLC